MLERRPRRRGGVGVHGRPLFLDFGKKDISTQQELFGKENCDSNLFIKGIYYPDFLEGYKLFDTVIHHIVVFQKLLNDVLVRP